MKCLLIFFLLLRVVSAEAQQYSLYTYYACCTNNTGSFAISAQGPLDSVVWSNGAIGAQITNVVPGSYVAYIYWQGHIVDSLKGIMYHDTWHISLVDGRTLFGYNISLPQHQSSQHIHPNCEPVGSYKVIVWKDSIPIDTLTFTNFNSNSGAYFNNVVPGHRYDMSIYDPSCNCYEGTWNISLYTGMVVLNLKVYLQGLYISGGAMMPTLYNVGGNPKPDACDSIFVELHRSNSPYSLVTSASAIVHKDGNAQVLIPNTGLLYQNFYISVKHRNSIETWSKNPVYVGSSNISYNFTTAASMAFDDNEANLSDGRFAFYSGDVNQDGGVDALDMTLVENDSRSGAYGYLKTDLNGDGGADSLDMTIIESNGNAGVFAVHP